MVIEFKRLNDEWINNKTYFESDSLIFDWDENAVRKFDCSSKTEKFNKNSQLRAVEFEIEWENPKKIINI